MIAPIAPSAVEFHIHQVVPAFHVSIATKQSKKKRKRFTSLSHINRRGIHAKKMSAVMPEAGHANTSRSPDNKLYNTDEYFFKPVCLAAGNFGKILMATGGGSYLLI